MCLKQQIPINRRELKDDPMMSICWSMQEEIFMSITKSPIQINVQFSEPVYKSDKLGIQKQKYTLNITI